MSAQPRSHSPELSDQSDLLDRDAKYVRQISFERKQKNHRQSPHSLSCQWCPSLTAVSILGFWQSRDHNRTAAWGDSLLNFDRREPMAWIEVSSGNRSETHVLEQIVVFHRSDCLPIPCRETKSELVASNQTPELRDHSSSY